MGRYELFDHPSEQGIRGYGKTPAEAFEEAAKAMESIIADIDKIEAKQEREIKLENPDKEILLVKWLNELLYLLDVDGLVFSDFEVQIKNDELKARVKGEEFNSDKHGSGTIIKAPTYNELKVKEENGQWIAQCVVDV